MWKVNWKYTALLFLTLSLALFFIGADFSGESPVPENRKNVAPYEEEILDRKGDLQPGVVSVGGIGGGGFGTGFVVHEDGYIFTNSHVVAGCIQPGTDRVHIGTVSGGDYTAEVLAVADSARVDFAVLRAEQPMENVETLDVGNTANLDSGDIAFSIGHPGKLGSYVTMAGEVTSLSEDGFSVDMPSSQGASGSPVFDMNGEVVGILYGGTQTGENVQSDRDAVIWHGNKDRYEVESVTTAERTSEAEKFFREEFSSSLADEIFGSGGSSR